MTTPYGTPAATRPLEVADQGCFFVGGDYDPETDTMTGHAYVQYQLPAHPTYPYPLVLIHGGGQTGAGFLSTPAGRPGWATIFLAAGFAVYALDLPGRGRAQGHPDPREPGHPRTARDVAARVRPRHAAPLWPQAVHHTRWPGDGVPGDRVYDQFYASQVSGCGDLAQLELDARAAGAALLDRIGPAVLLAHSLGAPAGWQIADARPDLTHAVVAVEPSGPPVRDVRLVGAPTWFEDGATTRPWGITSAPLTYDPPAGSATELQFVRHRAPGPGLAACWRQAEPARALPNLKRIPILIVTAEASYHAPYDHGTSDYLEQAGVHHDFVRLADRGIHGNGHMMMLEQNNGEVADLLLRWITDH
ncbi:alpha/beta hydrolase [Tsukamurella soli]|uniref:AB hydrolase-1 domain-containing protein n=1 Tax=Tsukamurella soli TaxID=644556 RepID=A0ABP8JFF9_9ACTN